MVPGSRARGCVSALVLALASGCSESPAAPADACGAAVTEHVHQGVLELSGTASVTLGAGPCELSRICVRDQAALHVSGSSTLVLTSDAPSVVLGRGVGAATAVPAKLHLTIATAAAAYLRVDATMAPFELQLDATQSEVSILIEGSSGLKVEGLGAANTIYGGDPTTFPACP